MVSKLTIAALALSGAGHAGAYVALDRVPRSSDGRYERTTVSFNILPAEQPPAPPEPPEPEPPAQEQARPSVPASAEPAPPEPVDQPEAAEEAAVDLTGITLTHPGGAGWQSAAGDGSSRSGPIRNVSLRPKQNVSPASAARTKRSRPTRPAPPRVVQVADLSRPPRAPSLDHALQANYPQHARAAGLSGVAVVRARITSSGRAQALGIVSESAPGFGQACLMTLGGSRWSPPLDKQGRPCATEIKYRCRFNVQR